MWAGIVNAIVLSIAFCLFLFQDCFSNLFILLYAHLILIFYLLNTISGCVSSILSICSPSGHQNCFQISATVTILIQLHTLVLAVELLDDRV